MFAGQPLWSAFNRRADADPGARGARSGDLAETARVPPSPASPDSGAERPRPPEHRLAADTGDGDNSANHISSFHARLVKESFAVIEPRALEAMEHFYAWLFVRHPEIRAMFPLAMSEHRERVLGALARIVWSMDSPAALDSYLRQLGRDHRKFAVKGQALPGLLRRVTRHGAALQRGRLDRRHRGRVGSRPRLHGQDHAGGRRGRRRACAGLVARRNCPA